jgi:peroxiredoxin
MRGSTVSFYTAGEMTTAVSSPRRGTFWLAGLLLLLGGAYWAATSGVRAHVDGLIGQRVGQPLPEFHLVDQAGTEWTAAALRGRRAVLHFFRSRCHACLAEVETLRAFERALPADVVLLHVLTDAVLGFPAAETAATLQRCGFTAPVVQADQALLDSLHRKGWANVTPVTYVVDAQGLVRAGLRGRQEPGAVEVALAAAR